MVKTWIVYGEDPNCDLGGSHIEPILGYFEGEYADVLAYAKTLKGWSAWGAGGKVKEYTIPVFKKINKEAMGKQNLLKIEKEKLLSQLAEIEKQIY